MKLALVRPAQLSAERGDRRGRNRWRAGGLKPVVRGRHPFGRGIQGAAPSRTPSDDLSERLAFNELHRIKMHAALAADRVDLDDVLVPEARRRLRLVFESLQMPRVHRPRVRQHLQCDPPAERNLLRLEHDAHAAPADLADQPEIAQLAQRRQVVPGASEGFADRDRLAIIRTAGNNCRNSSA